MRARTKLGVGILALVALSAGCSDAHQRQDDGGALGDSGPMTCHPGDPSPLGTFFCVYVGADHVCGDAGYAPECIDGAWQCPSGTQNSSQCWCSGFGPHDPSCVCTPSGWSCPPAPADAGIDASPECPADFTSAIGTACAFEGQSCGDCPNPCSGFCNLLTCVSGTWQTLELGCADPTFACGPATSCGRGSEYCEHTLSDTGAPDDYRCLPFPADCANDCTCWTDTPGTGGCASDGAGGITVTLGGA